MPLMSVPLPPSMQGREHQMFPVLDSHQLEFARRFGGEPLRYFLMTTQYRNPFLGPFVLNDTLTTPYEYRATFFDTPYLTVRARAQDGEVIPMQATVTRSGQASTTELLPYNSVAWTPAQGGTLAMKLLHQLAPPCGQCLE